MDGRDTQEISKNVHILAKSVHLPPLFILYYGKLFWIGKCTSLLSRVFNITQNGDSLLPFNSESNFMVSVIAGIQKRGAGTLECPTRYSVSSWLNYQEIVA